MKKLIQKHIHLDMERNRHFLNQRGHMLAFLLFAFAGSLMINNFAAPINQANASYFEEVMPIE